MEGNNQQFAVYKRGITFIENCALWRALPDINHAILVDNAKAAREYAFNTKYGNFDYEKDLRSKYPNWYKPIVEVLKERKVNTGINIIGVGSNNGAELKQIFTAENGFSSATLEVLDLSNSAINSGKNTFKDITFTKGDMESPAKSLKFDVYLNLRSIHSSGIDFKLALSECYRILKSGGFAIVSVSNGYLTPKKPGSEELFEIQGLYDNRTESFSKYKPHELAKKILSKLIDYGFNKPIIVAGDTEIFVIAQKL